MKKYANTCLHHVLYHYYANSSTIYGKKIHTPTTEAIIAEQSTAPAIMSFTAPAFSWSRGTTTSIKSSNAEFTSSRTSTIPMVRIIPNHS